MRGILATIALCLLSAVLYDSALAADGSVAEVVSVKDGATYSLYDRMDKLRKGMKIPVNSVIHTDGSGEAIIEFFDGARLEIEPDSEVFLIDFANSPRDEVAIFSLQSGVAKLTPGDPAKRGDRPLVLHTPQAKVEAKDAPLLIQARDGKNHIYVDAPNNRGVAVYDKMRGNELEILQSGEIATIAPDGAGECGSSACILRRFKTKKPKS